MDGTIRITSSGSFEPTSSDFAPGDQVLFMVDLDAPPATTLYISLNGQLDPSLFGWETIRLARGSNFHRIKTDAPKETFQLSTTAPTAGLTTRTANDGMIRVGSW